MSKNRIPGELRRSQLISPFGVGSLYNRQDGSSVVICGLDFWLEGLDSEALYKLEIKDIRLQKQLRVNKLYRPPATLEDSDDLQDQKLKFVPVLRFPTWYVCSYCGNLERKKLYQNSRVDCSSQHKGGFKSQMYQVSYIAMCKDGHLEDFPWNEFVHKNSNPTCKAKLRLREALSGDMQNVIVNCTECKASRKISEVMSNFQFELGRSNLSKMLDAANNDFLCGSVKPWLGISKREIGACNNDLYPSFRGAGNVYFPFTESALLIPEGSKRMSDLIARLSSPRFILPRNKARNGLMNDAVKDILEIAKSESEDFGLPNWIEIDSYSSQEINDALLAILKSSEEVQSNLSEVEEDFDAVRIEFRNQEYRRLRESSEDEFLTVTNPDGSYDEIVESNFNQIKLVTSLTETRAFAGFARVSTMEKPKTRDLRNLLRLNPIRLGSSQDWLPAIQVKGEGIFLELDSDKIQQWENSEVISERWQNFGHSDLVQHNGFDISPRFVLIHTLSHLILKELTFFCGYTQAALRERIYSSVGDSRMCGFLIYTASGDSEGTLGGLVRMGKPGFLEEVIENALMKATWCSNDPVCMENTTIGGDESTLASCYACTLIPETSCEAFNKYLDRAFVIGNPKINGLGFMNAHSKF